MPRESCEILVDLSIADNKRRLMAFIGSARGIYEVCIKPRRPSRTLQQNSFYWGFVVRPFAQFLRDQGQAIDDQEAHDLMRAKFLRRSIVDHATGEVIGQAIRSTTSLDVAEFSEYLDRCIHWLADMFGIIVPDPEAIVGPAEGAAT